MELNNCFLRYGFCIWKTLGKFPEIVMSISIMILQEFNVKKQKLNPNSRCKRSMPPSGLIKRSSWGERIKIENFISKKFRGIFEMIGWFDFLSVKSTFISNAFNLQLKYSISRNFETYRPPFSSIWNLHFQISDRLILIRRWAAKIPQ